MAEEMEIEDGSNDKAYFTMVPNIVLNHSSAVDQALYMQMKRFAGEKSGGGLCTASHRTLMEKLKIGPKALKTSLEYLISHGWIENVGARKVMTNGGPQDVQMYRVNDIWKLNVQHYKGANESVPLSKGGDERHKGADERSKGGDESATTKNNTKTIELGAVATAPRVIVQEPSFGGEGESVPALKKEKDANLDRSVKYWRELCKRETDLLPSTGIPTIKKILKNAHAHLTWPQIKQKMDEWFDVDGLQDHEKIQITRCFSTVQIDAFKAENV